ncbi:MAG: AAA family ATPase [Candidatus Omnitrophota bacterium]|nr:AAA family ATPase [Candidatus Omnitrophota bacterium]MDZ4242319.1 AAA family ATPase [Candidatus Omnitrophota bacterium]
MYKEYYNLAENPFNVTSDPAFYFSSSRHAEAFSHLVYGIQERKGILVVTGEIGTGKTTLCRTLLNQLDPHIKTALILNPYFSETQLLQLIIKDLGITGEYKNKLTLITALNDFLLEQASHGNNVVLVIDEAQNLRVRQLEQLRLLSNLETEKAKLLQILLVGQPELLDKLKLDSLRQLNQRVSVRYHILPLEKNEIPEYINHRIKVACRSKNGKLPVTFTPGAVDALFTLSKGTPRVINILCDRALLAGYVAESHNIDEQMVYKCAREINL